jgi:hypothetical protein
MWTFYILCRNFISGYVCMLLLFFLIFFILQLNIRTCGVVLFCRYWVLNTLDKSFSSVILDSVNKGFTCLSDLISYCPLLIDDTGSHGFTCLSDLFSYCPLLIDDTGSHGFTCLSDLFSYCPFYRTVEYICFYAELLQWPCLAWQHDSCWNSVAL